jgi:hypothetical protein
MTTPNNDALEALNRVKKFLDDECANTRWSMAEAHVERDLETIRSALSQSVPGNAIGDYHVTYFYLASGMEGEAEKRDCGIVKAKSKDEAKNAVALREFPTDEFYGPNSSFSSREFFKGCLTASLITPQCPEGWKMVPVEPTPEMEKAAFNVWEINPGAVQAAHTGMKTGTDVRNAIYKAMISASPAKDRK